MSHWKNKGCVLNCEEFIATDNGFVEVDFYDFPSDEEIRGIWVDRVRKQKKTKSWYPNTNSKLCGMHFNNSGKNIHNEVLPRFFGEKIYTPVRIIEPDVENVTIKEEIDVDDDPMSEENCIADYSNIYNTVPSKTNSLNETFDPTVFELTKIKEENLDFESEENPFSENDIYEPQVQLEVTENTALLNGYTFQKDYVNHQKEDIGSSDPYLVPSCQWKHNGPYNGKKAMLSRNIHTHSDDCSRDLEQLKNQMKELEENLSTAHHKIEEGKLLVENLSKKEKESNKVKQELEEENKKLKSFLANTMSKYVPEEKPSDSKDSLKESPMESPMDSLKNSPQDMSYLDLKEETSRLEMQLARTREKMKRLHEQWYRKFESFGSDEEVRFYTGFKTGAEFKKFCNLAIEMDPALEPSSEENFNVRKQIMITLMRLRLGLQLQDLAFRYNINLDEVLQFVSHWQGILSKSFFNRKICQSGVIIVKFFVVELCNKIKLKYFLGVSPFGYVIYVSDLHPHLTNERDIIVSSEILALIEEGFTVKSLDTDRFAELGISLWSVSHEEGLEFRTYISNLLKKVIKNGIFKNIHPTSPSWTKDVSRIWKICCYLQNYIEF